MKKLIEVDDYIIMVDADSNIKMGDIVYRKDPDSNKNKIGNYVKNENMDYPDIQKIIGSTRPLERKIENGKKVFYFKKVKKLDLDYCKKYIKSIKN